jgi:hypothetical protein
MRPSGGHIRIANVPIPEKSHLSISGQTRIKPAFILCAEHYSQASERTNQYMELEGKIDDFFNLLAQDRYYMGRSHNYSLKRDITGHYLRTKAVKSILHGDIDSLKPEVFKMFFRDYIMCEKRPNIDKIFNEVDRSFGKVKLFLKFIKEFRGDPQGNLARLFDRNDELHIRGMGPFVISQFLAGGHPMDYAVIEDRMVDTMKKFSLIDVKVRSGTPNGYLYISAMCRKLFNDVFKRKIEENKERLGFEIDEDFGLVVVHEFFWEYYEFDSYDVLSLEEASGEAREEEESMATENLEQIGLLTQD